VGLFSNPKITVNLILFQRYNYFKGSEEKRRRKEVHRKTMGGSQSRSSYCRSQ